MLASGKSFSKLIGQLLPGALDFSDELSALLEAETGESVFG